MSYDYNSQDKRFDFPNPYRIENFFYFGAAGILSLGGILLLISSRDALGSGSFVAMTPLIIGVILLVKGLIYAAQAMSRLRFFFGRGQPNSMAKELTQDQAGTTPAADVIKELLRHNSLSFLEPTGPLNGALYSVIPNLIYAPMRVQWVAQRQFQNALAIIVTLVALGISMIGAGHDATAWLGLFFFCMALFLLIKPLEMGALGQSSLGFKGLVGLILVAILGPVLIPLLSKGIAAPNWLPGIGQAAFLLIVSECAIVLFFLAVINQTLKTPPQASMAVVQGTLTMNSHPKQVLDELERCMQEQWVASLPNRRYTRLIPEVLLNAQSGSFVGDLLEETQPVPRSEMQSLTMTSCFAEPRYRWLGWLNSYGLIMMVFSVVAMILFALKFYTASGFNKSTIPSATLGFSLLILGNFCFRAGNVLWGRFDFVSRLIWVEMKGNYQSAQMDYGNQFTDRIKTQKQVINIESMTLRVWVVEIETVAFGKDSPRSILGMRGMHDEATALHDHLTNFGQQQSMIVAPTSEVDLQRAKSLGVMNHLGTPSPSGVQALPGAVSQAIRNAAEPASEPSPTNARAHSDLVTTGRCPACYRNVDVGSAFCDQCGAKL